MSITVWVGLIRHKYAATLCHIKGSRQTTCSCGGVSGGNCNLFLRCVKWKMTCICPSPLQGRCPVHISHRSTPKAYTSADLLSLPAWHTSRHFKPPSQGVQGSCTLFLYQLRFLFLLLQRDHKESKQTFLDCNNSAFSWFTPFSTIARRPAA